MFVAAGVPGSALSVGTHVGVAWTCLWFFVITISRSACVSFQVEAVGDSRVVSSLNSICTAAAAWKSLGTRSSVSENDDDGELTSRRMRLFPDCGRLTCMLPCLCIVAMLCSTVVWLIAFFQTLLSPLMAGGAAGAVTFSFESIASIFAMAFTLYACVSRRPLPCWQPSWRRVAPLGVLAAILQVVVLLLMALACEWVDQQACDQGDDETCQFYSLCKALVPLSTVVGILVVLSGVVLVGFYMRDQVESGRQRVELKAAKIRWVIVNSFKKWNEQRKCIPRFQDLEEHDYVEGWEVWSFTAWLLGTRCVVSHAWITSEHPDPDGVQLKALLRQITKCNRWKFWKLFTGSYDVVFFDFASLPQNGPRGAKRNDEEKRLFGKALAGMNLLYSHRLFRVLIILDTPTPQPGNGAECRPYKNRGWCYTELAMSTACGTVVNHFSSDVRQLTKQQKMPVLPEKFRENFEVKESTKSRRPSYLPEDPLEILSARGDRRHVASEGRLHGLRRCVVRPLFRQSDMTSDE